MNRRPAYSVFGSDAPNVLHHMDQNPVFHREGISMNAALRQCLVLGVLLAFSACGSKGNPVTPPPPPPTPPPAPPTVTLSSVSVSGGNAVTVGQTVQFTATANMSNGTTQNVSTTASWQSSNASIATVSNTGLATGVAQGNADIRATFQGMTGSLGLQVNPPATVAPVARFTVSGPGGSNVCRIIPNSGGDIDCTFDGSASTGGTGGAINRWTWRYDVGANSRLPINENDPIHNPNPGCGFFADKTGLTPQGGTAFVQMIVKLVVRNTAGTESAEERNSNVRLFPQNQCGFAF
jgi:hypothetical protein